MKLFKLQAKASRFGARLHTVPGTFPTYRAAVIHGQQTYGWGCFTVAGKGEFVPTREQQLLEPELQVTPSARKKAVLEML